MHVVSEERGALERGLAVIRLLNEDPGLTLEQIVRTTGYPKTSLFRILQTLAAEGVVLRDSQGVYQPLACLQLLVESGFEEKLRQAMRLLAAETGQTVEWYLPQSEGMVIASRETPRNSETGVLAGLGYVRSWHEELEAVLCMGLAFLKPDAVTVDLAGLSAYQKPFVLGPLSRKCAEERIALAAAAGSIRDDIPNANNVRRVAALIRHGGRPVGVLAIAEVVHPAEPDRIAELETCLVRSSARLNG